jgi:eukaryotic-like serine/threonine-protein kinase
MTKTAFWKADWFLGLVVAVLLLFASNSTLIQGLERGAYDVGVRASDRVPSDRVAIIAIDDQSIANIGRWPWSRDLHAQMIELLSRSGAKAVGYASFFFEPQVDPGLIYIERLVGLYNELPQNAQEQLPQFGSVLAEAEDTLNSDRKLASAIAGAGNVALPMLFQLGEPRGNPDSVLPDFVLKSQLTKVVDRIGAGDSYLYPVPAQAAAIPLSEIAGAAGAIGHLNAAPDIDGSIRTEPLVIR